MWLLMLLLCSFVLGGGSGDVSSSVGFKHRLVL